jgi:hypothetical protein
MRVSKPSSFEIKDYKLTSEQLIYIMDKFLRTTSDFWGTTFKNVGFCDNLLFRCTKSRDVWYKTFGKDVYGINVCVPNTYDKAHYKFQIKNNSGKIQDAKTYMITFNKNEQELVKQICKYKEKYDGRGDDPKCAVSLNDLEGGTGYNDFKVLTEHLNNLSLFKTAVKKIFTYKRVPTLDNTDKSTFYIHTGDETQVITYVNGEKETTNTCRSGDFVITGIDGEKYVIPPHKLLNNYNVVDNVLVTRQQPRQVASITKTLLKKLGLKEEIEFTASWGEAMVLKAGNYLVKEDTDKYYRIEGSIFKKTYKLNIHS